MWFATSIFDLSSLSQISRWQTTLTFPPWSVYLVNTLQSYGLYITYILCCLLRYFIVLQKLLYTQKAYTQQQQQQTQTCKCISLCFSSFLNQKFFVFSIFLFRKKLTNRNWCHTKIVHVSSYNRFCKQVCKFEIFKELIQHL